MRNLWMIISGAALVVGVSGAVYYFFPKQQANPLGNSQIVDSNSPTEMRVLVAPPANPLLSADRDQFKQWVPLYPIRCGEIVFEKADRTDRNFSFCVGQITRRVAMGTGHETKQEEVTDPGVKTHWNEVMRAR
jgi:hypothetical protein